MQNHINSTMKHEIDGDTKSNWSLWNDPQKPRKETRKLEINGRIVTILTKILKTLMSPGYPRKLAVTETSAKRKRQLKMVGKTRKEPQIYLMRQLEEINEKYDERGETQKTPR